MKVYQIKIIRNKDRAYSVSYHKGNAWSAMKRACELIDKKNKEEKDGQVWGFEDIHRI